MHANSLIPINLKEQDISMLTFRCDRFSDGDYPATGHIGTGVSARA